MHRGRVKVFLLHAVLLVRLVSTTVDQHSMHVPDSVSSTMTKVVECFPAGLERFHASLDMSRYHNISLIMIDMGSAVLTA